MIYYRVVHRYKKPDWKRYEVKGIGLFTAQTGALDAIDAVINQPGFSDWPDGFQVTEVRLDEIPWALILADIEPADAPDGSS